jgi:16S rRNA (cytidine1402-2'-O)-methyltransferase
VTASPPGSAGELVVIATPIGNLGDLTPRARERLGEVDVLCCEDTRTTGRLLSLVGITPPRLMPLHEHNEHERASDVVERLLGGGTVGLVCDAGTPLLSDPGSRLVRAAIAAGITVTALPGASAALTALCVSGLGGGRFRFEGFLPRKGAERASRLAAIAASVDPVIVYEAPGRVAATVVDLAAACGLDREVAVARELTKLHEETWRGPLGHAATAHAVTVARGEYVLVVGGATVVDDGPVDLDGHVARLASAGLGRRDAVAALEVLLGVTHRAAYDAALAHQGFIGRS